MRVSNRLRIAVLLRRAEGQTQYSIARAAGLHPSTLSQLIHDTYRLKADDPRVLALARVVGVEPADAFEGSR